MPKIGPPRHLLHRPFPVASGLGDEQQRRHEVIQFLDDEPEDGSREFLIPVMGFLSSSCRCREAIS